MKAGIVITATSRFLDKYKSDLFYLIDSTLKRGLTVPDAEVYYDLSIGRIYLSLENQRLDNFTINSENSKVIASDSHDYLVVSMQNAELNFELDFELYSVPDWVEDQGKGFVNISDFSLSFHLHPHSNDGLLYINITDMEVNVANITVELKGKTDFSKSVNQYQDKFKSLFQNSLA